MTDGLLVVDKPAGMTSHDVVAVCRRCFGQKRVGHAGTLDPDATGVLLVGLGRATRLMQYLTGLDKTYRAQVVLGSATSTLDASGEVTGTWDMSGVTLEQARQAARDLTGTISQVPPMVSAVKVGGQRLHALARAGIEVERPARSVTVYRFELELAAGPAPTPGTGPVLDALVECSSGTYVRTLAADLGEALGGGAHLRSLRRLAVGAWREGDAVALAGIEEGRVLPPAAALRSMAQVTVDGAVAADVGHGKVLASAQLGAGGAGPWAVLDRSGMLLAVYEAHGEGRAKPSVVLAPAGRSLASPADGSAPPAW